MVTSAEHTSELFVEIGGVGAAVTLPRTLLDPLARRISGPTGSSSGSAAVRYRITTDADDLYGLERGHGGVRHNVDAAVVLDQLLADMCDVVHRRCPSLVLARAGAVAVGGRGVVVLGSPEAGTTTLVNALVAAGATLLSDGLAAFDLHGRVHPVVMAGDHRRFSDDPLPQVAPEAVPVSMVIDTAHEPGVDWKPIEVTGARAVLALLEHVAPGQQREPSARALLGTLAPRVVQLRGRRPEADRVAADVVARAEERPVVDLALSIDGVDAGPSRGVGHQRSTPAGHLRFDDFLPPEEHGRLLDHALSREAEFAPSEVLTEEQVDDHANLRRSQTIFDLSDVWEAFERRLTALLPHIRRELGIAWFDLGAIERQLTVHGDGDHFTLHIDNAGPHVAARIISAVYYFNREPRAFSGGELRLFDTVERAGRIEPADTFTEVVPTDNTLVVFGSHVPHEVRPVRVPGDAFADRRFTIVCWALRAPTPAELFSGDADRLAELQHELLPALTSDGFRVVPTPEGIQARLAEVFAAGAVSASDEMADENILPTGIPSMIELGDLGPLVHEELKSVHEQWFGAALEPTFHYGLRVYRDGQTLSRHTDRYETHVISSVVHVAADVDEPWPLSIEDHDGQQHDVYLEPGEMLLYEGARLAHSRPHPLRGRHYASVFLHYRPPDWSRALERACRQAGSRSPA